MEPGLKPVVLKQLPGHPVGAVDERSGEIFVSPSVAKKLRAQGCIFNSIEVYVDGRWRQLIVGSRFS